MIEKIDENTFSLQCDNCGDDADEFFDSFMEAVDFKKDNGWKSLKDSQGYWQELCPSCSNQSDIVAEIRGHDDRHWRRFAKDAAEMAEKMAKDALDDF